MSDLDAYFHTGSRADLVVGYPAAASAGEDACQPAGVVCQVVGHRDSRADAWCVSSLEVVASRDAAHGHTGVPALMTGGDQEAGCSHAADLNNVLRTVLGTRGEVAVARNFSSTRASDDRISASSHRG